MICFKVSIKRRGFANKSISFGSPLIHPEDITMMNMLILGCLTIFEHRYPIKQVTRTLPYVSFKLLMKAEGSKKQKNQ
jgi:hypothetical protein